MSTKTLPLGRTGPIRWSANPTTGVHDVLSIPEITYTRGSRTYIDRPKGESWRSLIKKGQSATTAGWGTHRVWEGSQTFVLAYVTSIGQYVGTVDRDNTGFTINPVYDYNVRNLAYAKYTRKAQEAQHKLQIGQFVGELSQTLHLIGSPLRSFHRATVDYLRRVKKLPKIKNIKTRKKRLAEAWLTYRFGAKPLLSDIDAAMHDLAEYTVNTAPPTARVFASGKLESVTVARTGGTHLSAWRFEREVTTKSESVCKITGKVRLTLPTQIIYPNGLLRGFQEFVPTLWEVMPWSWAADYFTNIGDILNCLTYLSTNHVWSCMTDVATNERWEDLKYYPNKALTQYQFLGSDGRNTLITTKSWQRFDSTGMQFVPSFMLKLPTSPVKLANLLAAFVIKNRFSFNIVK